MSDLDAEPVLTVTDLSVRFSGHRLGLGRASGQVTAVDEVSLEMRRGAMVGLVGESGSGKTTLGRAILQLVRPTSGSVRFRDTELTALRGKALRRIRADIQMVFQNPDSTLNPRLRVGKSVAEPLLAQGMPAGEAKARVAELLGMIGLPPDHASRYPHQFSGGQRQRLGIARALATGPSLVVCDEPTASLDVSIQGQVLNLLLDLREQSHAAFLFISHDLGVVRRVCDEVLVMYRGRIVEAGPAAEVTRQPRHPYTRTLLEAAPPDPREAVASHPEPTVALRPTDLASGALAGQGCPFRDRCWLYTGLGEPEVCRTQRPPLEGAGGRASACHFPDDVTADPGGDPAPAHRPDLAVAGRDTTAEDRT